jgi:transcription initiation factor TFIIIB Brf1 subunit/transcription initiation factor TFIIB
VKKLGGAFTRLVQHEGLKLDIVSPSLFVDRITKAMKLGCDNDTLYRIRQYTHDMIHIAQRNWLHIGRLPQALCAAAAIIAAKVLQFSPSIHDIALHLHVAVRYYSNS